MMENLCVGCGLVVVGNVTWLIEFAELGRMQDVDCLIDLNDQRGLRLSRVSGSRFGECRVFACFTVF